MTKVLILDTGPLINFSLNGLLEVLPKLKQVWKGKLIISSYVKYELCDRPLKIKKFELGALRIQELIDNKVLEFPNAVGINEKDLVVKTNELTEKANHLFQTEGHWLQIVSPAEMSCIALSKMLASQRVESMVAIDERTARMLGERPANLAQLMSKKLHKLVKMLADPKTEFEANFIRSSEIAYIVQKKGLIGIKDKRALEALLYATKFNGASISFDEIEVIKKIN